MNNQTLSASNTSTNRKSRIRRARANVERGFSLVECLIIVVIIALVELAAAIFCWGITFAFTSDVLVPWLGVPEAWAKTASFLLSIILLGGTAGILGAIVVILGGLVIVAFARNAGRKSRGGN